MTASSLDAARAGAVLRPAERPEIRRAGGATTRQMVTPAIGAGAFVNGFTLIPPGGAIALHFHDCEESVLILRGTARIEVGAALFDGAAGDVTWLPPLVPHRFINASESEPLEIFWTYGSVYATRTLVGTGATAPILAEAGTEHAPSRKA